MPTGSGEQILARILMAFGALNDEGGPAFAGLAGDGRTG
jgi:hypothetical protein